MPVLSNNEMTGSHSIFQALPRVHVIGCCWHKNKKHVWAYPNHSLMHKFWLNGKLSKSYPKWKCETKWSSVYSFPVQLCVKKGCDSTKSGRIFYREQRKHDMLKTSLINDLYCIKWADILNFYKKHTVKMYWIRRSCSRFKQKQIQYVYSSHVLELKEVTQSWLLLLFVDGACAWQWQ